MIVNRLRKDQCIKKGNRPMNYFISDLHLGHKNVTKEGTDFDNRPFDTLEEMNTELIRRWNSVVTNADHIYVLGDMCWKCGEYSINLVKQLKGNIHLITGNHDRFNGEYKKLFIEISPYKEIHETVNGVDTKIILSHFPIMFYNGMHHGSIQLYGHVHNTIEEEIFQQVCSKLNDMGITSKCYNVGCMMPYMNYTPRTLDEIM